MKKDVILKVENLSKQYRLGTLGTGTVSHDLNRWWYKIRGKEDPYLKIGETNDRSKKSESQYVWALRNIDFEVERGEIVGIIGKNGAGKSTLLKILSKVTGPTTGSIKSKGRIASLLEVGTGFHPEMTGRENIYLNGAILGMTRSEISEKINDIIDFSGCERYIDTPAKRYSSGMTVRLAFAVAAFLEPDVLVVDEVLAVGDAEFQKKAIGKMQDISNAEGRTVLFVSHDMGAISSLCSRTILLNNGEVAAIGDTTKMIDHYLNGVSAKSSSFDLVFGQCTNQTVNFKTVYNKPDSTVFEGQFFVKLIDYTGVEIMLYEKKMKKNESVVRDVTIDIGSLNVGVYSLQVKIWGLSNLGKKLTLVTPFYPLKITDRDNGHIRVFAGKINIS